VEAQAERTPDAVAVDFEGTRLTYGQLERRANQLAHHLRSLGVGPEVLVALCVERSAEAVVAMLAILKAGGAYVPLDPSYPQERLALMLEDAKAPVLLLQEHLLPRLPRVSAAVVRLDGTGQSFAHLPAEPPQVACTDNPLAYVCYTSGSTGRPKGVCVTHRGVVRLLVDTDYVQLSPRDRVAQASNLSFDAATFEVWGALIHGACLVGIGRDVALDPERYAQRIREHGLTVVFMTTALFNQFARTRPSAFTPLRYLLFGGEACDPGAIREVLEKGRPQHLLHVYGPTEVTTFSTWYEVRSVPEDATTVPIGGPIAHTSCHVLDEALAPVAPGGLGELYLGGPRLARGYLGQPELTAQRFIADPFSPDPEARLYRTGDRVRLLPEGALVFVGRVDRQVKLRGFRIEPGEVEVALSRCPGVREALVLVREDSPGEKRLVAYLVTRPGQELDEEAVREALGRQVPEYMVPSAFVSLESFPLTPNGKVDHSALPAPEEARGEDFVAPGNEVERTLARVWADVLRRERVGLHDNFFDLGGDSILAVRLVARAHQAGLSLTVPLLFTHPTVGELATRLAPEAPREVPAVEATKEPLASLETSALERLVGRAGLAEDILPLSPTQQGMLFHSLEDTGPEMYLEQLGIELRGPLDVHLLIRAWESVLRRHPALRSSFHWKDLREPVQVVHRHVTLPFEERHWSSLPPASREEHLRELEAAERRGGLESTRAPLMRLVLVRFAPDLHHLLWTFHHLLVDGWSRSQVLSEVFRTYAALGEGREPELGTPPAFREYLAWLKRQDLSRAETYWRQELAGVTGPTPVPVERTQPEGEVRPAEQLLHLSVEETERARAFARQHRLTLHTLVQGAWALLLGQHSGERSVVLGTTVAGRPPELPGIESIVGLFIHTLPLRVELPGNASAVDFLQRLQARNSELRQYECTPLAHIQRWAGLPGQSLFDSIVVFENYPAAEALAAPAHGLRARVVSDFDHTHYPLALFAVPGQELLLRLRHDGRIGAPAVTRLLRQLRTLLLGLVEQPQRRLESLPLLSSEERERMLGEWNATRADFNAEACVHELIEAQVARTPEAVALVFEDKSLTYRELDTRANRLARHLRSLGVGPDTRVAVHLERSLELVVGLLAILKAGGAYVPLDPNYPKDRLSLMLEDSGATLVLTRRGLAGHFEGSSARTVSLDADRERIAREDGGPLPRSADARHLAYVLYTSGSTGRPKGVMVAHRNVANFFTAMDQRLGKDPGTWLAVTSISFDISVLELLWTLSRGFKVVVQEDALGAGPRPVAAARRKVGFSLFYFASDDEAAPGPQRYRLLMEGARFADEHGFEAVWTPERHFFGFGGLYPSPSVMGAALASITRRVHLRAGSVVSPLHNELRLTEEWALVDNLSNGRVGVSFASGWHANDFVLAPQQYAQRHQVMYRQLEAVRRLWRGESVELPNGLGEPVTVRVRPRPVQAELPVWITTSGNIDTFRSAGRVGANVLTHLLGQTVEQLTQKIAAYREARREAGHAGEGHVTLMLHTFVGQDTARVKETVRGPFSQYLRGSVELLRSLPEAARTARLAQGEAPSGEDLDAVVDAAFERYFATSGLFGTPDDCLATVERLRGAGVDEVGCLIDFGVDTDEVLASLRALDEVRERANAGTGGDYSLPAQLVRHGVTHLQCTPSLARALLLEPRVAEALAPLRKLLVGGEALPEELAEQLQRTTRAELLDMYGPTETTVWSTTHSVSRSGDVALGTPIANTRVYVLDAALRPVPVGVPGELLIGGEGVVRGYLRQPELTAERFIPDPFGPAGSRLYRTGDLVRWRTDGTLEYLGRMDLQVKLRGHRIELGEIESLLRRLPGVREAVVVAREDSPGDKRLVAYVVAQPGPLLDGSELGRHLARQLPDYMVPSAFVLREALPLTPNGKVDRKALMALAPPLAAPLAPEAYAAPRNPTEESLANLFGQLLHLPQVSIHDDFFELGGHSMLATQLVSRMRVLLGVELPVRHIFETSTVAGLAELLSRLPPPEVPEIPRTEDLSDAEVEALLEEMIAKEEASAR
jgi:natural product biosynthesis luciferase-like monooxygenase protein/amino acid adenylation domain-containing protein